MCLIKISFENEGTIIVFTDYTTDQNYLFSIES